MSDVITSEWDRDYIARQFEKARGGNVIKIKVRGEDGESNWINTPAERLDEITSAVQGGTANGYRDRAGIDNRANSALLSIEAIMDDYSIPAAVRLALVAEIIAEEPILTDGSPAARTVRREIARKRGL